MIWHDMMFACAMYVGTQDYLDNIAAETRDNVKRLRNHPSIAMWGGNNEVYIIWKDRDWQTSLNNTQEENDLMWQWYLDIFHVTIPNIVNVIDPDRFYWETSPITSATTNNPVGDIHNYNVWGSRMDVEFYDQSVGRFDSEYGMQGMIPMSSIKKFSTPSDWDQSSFVM